MYFPTAIFRTKFTLKRENYVCTVIYYYSGPRIYKRSAGAKVLLETNYLELLTCMPMYDEICRSYKNSIFKISVIENLGKIILGKICLKIEI